MKLRKLAFLAPIVMAVALMTPGSAYAASAATVTGSGTIAPGLTATPTAQTNITFSGTATGVFNNTPGSCTIAFAGSSQGNLETVASGAGGGTATCTGAGISCTATLTYSRTGAVVTVGGSASCNGTPCTLSGRFIFTPRNANPTTAYDLAGEIDC